MASISERLDAMEAEIRKPRFRESTGMANEVNYWVFDYPPEKELEVRERMSIFTISAWQRRKYILTSREAHPEMKKSSAAWQNPSRMPNILAPKYLYGLITNTLFLLN